MPEQFANERLRVRPPPEEFLQTCHVNTAAYRRVQTQARYLERLVFLPAAAGLEDRLAVFGSACRVEGVGLEDGSVHISREDERVRISTGRSTVRQLFVWQKGITHP